MPKSNSKGGKNHKKAKSNQNSEIKRDMVFRDDGQEYCLMTKMLGDGRCEGQLLNGQSTMVMAHIRGKMKKRVFIHMGDVVLVGLRDFQEGKVDIIHKYTSEEAKNLVHLGEIAELSESRTCKDIDISSSHEEKEKTGDDNFVDIDFEKI